MTFFVKTPLNGYICDILCYNNFKDQSYYFFCLFCRKLAIFWKYFSFLQLFMVYQK